MEADERLTSAARARRRQTSDRRGRSETAGKNDFQKKKGSPSCRIAGELLGGEKLSVPFKEGRKKTRTEKPTSVMGV